MVQTAGWLNAGNESQAATKQESTTAQKDGGANSTRCGNAGQLPCRPILKTISFGYTTPVWRGIVDWVGILSLTLGTTYLCCLESMRHRCCGGFLCLLGILAIGMGMIHNSTAMGL